VGITDGAVCWFSVEFILMVDKMSRPIGQSPGDMHHGQSHHESLNGLLIENVKLRNEAVDLALEIEKLQEARKKPRLR
jgi:hypothetical protein